MESDLKEFDDIKDKIHTIRGKQVMLDKDLAELYGVETRTLNQAVSRNIERFPDDFMLKLNKKESDDLKSQNVISSWGGRRKLPVAFTEHGVAMLSGILKSRKAVEVNISIMRAFIAMRKHLKDNREILTKLNQLDNRVTEHDKALDEIFDKIEQKDLPEKGIFFDGSVFDAHKFAIDLISSAKSSIVLIDNYIDTSVLTLMSHKRKDVEVKIYTNSVTEKLKLAKEKFNKQYGFLELIEFRKAHDRFLIIDDVEVYHIGASLKDLGKKWFGFSRLQKEGLKVLDKF